MTWQDKDREQAKLRMRRRRAPSGGMSEFDRARNHAFKMLAEKHRKEFDQLRRDFLREYRKGRSA